MSEPENGVGADHTLAEIAAKAAEAAAEARATGTLVNERMKDIQRQLNLLAGIPSKIAAMVAKHEALVERVENLESAGDATRRWWRDHAPALAISVVALIVSVILTLHA